MFIAVDACPAPAGDLATVPPVQKSPSGVNDAKVGNDAQNLLHLFFLIEIEPRKIAPVRAAIRF